MEASTLTPIPNRGIELAFQLQAFRSSNPGCPHVTEFDGATLDLIEFIYTHYPVPLPKASSAYNSVPPETCPLRSGERLLHPLIYPVDWPIDRSILSKAIGFAYHSDSYPIAGTGSRTPSYYTNR